jgi:hypothetical protein
MFCPTQMPRLPTALVEQVALNDKVRGGWRANQNESSLSQSHLFREGAERVLPRIPLGLKAPTNAGRRVHSMALFLLQLSSGYSEDKGGAQKASAIYFRDLVSQLVLHTE